MAFSTVDTEIDALRELSARIGKDPMLTQASTGNTSIKTGGLLWIKASGAWLADAEDHDILIAVDLERARECVRRSIDPSRAFAGDPRGPSRVSVETAMHAVLPYRVSIHVHSVSAMAWAVRADGPKILESLLEGLRWRWVPYVPSGLPLASEIELILSGMPDTDVFILGNHGLVVCADCCRGAADLLDEVERRIVVVPRRAPEAQYRRLERLIDDNERWGLPNCHALHALATDPASRKILEGGILHPCQLMFSGAAADLFRAVPHPGTSRRFDESYCARSFLIVDDLGVLVRKTISRSEYLILSGLARVVQRICASDSVRYLTEREIACCPSSESYLRLGLPRVGS